MIADGAGVSLIHRTSLSDEIRNAAKAVCAEVGLDWLGSENHIAEDQ
jgi:hypothetical protein